jgi:hypothetical protein
MAVAQTLALNVAVNRVDWWVRHRAWANVGAQTWSTNLRLGWEWDEDEFPTNVMAHPYHGTLYFNAGRVNGLDYFESIPITFLGSWTWEYFGETERPSLNDFLMTTFGGITLGEMFHRVGSSLRDNQDRGISRVMREITALPFDPMGGLNRLVRGQWTAIGPNPPEHDPESYAVSAGGGLRFARSLVADSAAYTGAFVVDIASGDQFGEEYHHPFDVFNMRLIVSPYAGLNTLRASGRLYGRDLNDSTARVRHVLAINQRTDYVKNPALSVGGQNVEVGLNSRWRFGAPGSVGLRTAFFLDGIILGAIDGPGTGDGARGYDFGSGGGVRGETALEFHGVDFLRLHFRTDYMHTVSGASADHRINFGGVELTIPLPGRFGIATQLARFDRISHYADRRTIRLQYPEGRILFVWTKAR